MPSTLRATPSRPRTQLVRCDGRRCSVATHSGICSRLIRLPSAFAGRNTVDHSPRTIGPVSSKRRPTTAAAALLKNTRSPRGSTSRIGIVS